MGHIFISYAHSDMELMLRVKEGLNIAKLAIWTDESIELGTPSWKQAIEQAIIEADAVVAILSPDAKQSKWVRAELDFAEIHEKLIFLILGGGDERSAIPFGFASFQWIDLRHDADHENQIHLLAETLHRKLGLLRRPTSQAEEFRRGTQVKLQKLIDNFVEGNISREQFNVIYARYNSQLKILEDAISQTNPDVMKQPSPDGTADILENISAKPTGILVYHNSSKALLLKIGTPSTYEPVPTVLNEMWKQIEQKEFVEPQLNSTMKPHWILFHSRDTTLVVAQFLNEPSQRQLRYIERLHHDFGVANQAILSERVVDADKLVSPFAIVFENKLKK